MRVLHVSPAFAPAYAYGGPIPVLQELCLHLSSQGHEVRVLTTNSQGLKQKLDVSANKEICINDRFRVTYCKRLARHSVSLYLLGKLPEYIRWADVVHLTAVYNFPTLPTLLLCRILRKPIVWTPHGVLQRWKGSRRAILKALWENLCLSIAPKNVVLHAASKEEAAESSERFPGLSAAIIPWGISVSHPPPNRVDQDRSLKLLYLGRLDAKKGVENLIDACVILATMADLQWSLTIAGTGPSTYTHAIKVKIREAGLEENGNGPNKTIRMIGEVSARRKESLFASADVLLVPSHTENFSVVVGEALACEVPVIASKGTPWSRLQEIGCGLYVSNTPHSLASAILEMSRLPIREMGRRGREWVMRDFPWATSAEQMARCYSEILVAHSER